MTTEILLTVPARHLTTGDHFNGMTVMSIDRYHAGGDVTFKLVIPHTTHTMLVTVTEKDLDAVSFPLTKRGDDYNPNPRNAALGLPAVPPKPYVEPEPIAIYPAGTLLKDVQHFDRSMKVVFHCPNHPQNVVASKDPFGSSWFWLQDGNVACHCPNPVGEWVVHADYKPTRNG